MLKPILRRLYHRLRFLRVGIFSLSPSSACARYGTAYGGYELPAGEVNREWVCVCLGAGEDISFECALFDHFEARVVIADPTPRAIEHFRALQEQHPEYRSPRFQFFPVGVWSETTTMRFYSPQDPNHVSHSIVNMQRTETYFEAECVTPQDLLARSQCTSMDLLKLNVEGAEYAVMSAIFRAGLRPRLVCINFDELHTKADSGAGKRLWALGKQFRDAGYVPIAACEARVTYRLARGQ